MPQTPDRRPNLVFVFTDQQSAHMMSCTGNPWLKTPAMDRLAASGVRFDRAYCSDPVCVPSRFSLMTGRMPSEIALRSNDASHIEAVPDHIKETGLGWLFRRAGYEPMYGGKVHLPKLTPEDIGFDVLTGDQRDGLADACVEYLGQDHEKPFLLVASFINPHDICYMAIRDSMEDEKEKRLVSRGRIELERLDQALQLPEGVSEAEFFDKHCPTLPPNYEPQEDEPEAIRWLLSERPFKQKARERWPDERWRMHRWAYCRLTEMVDAQIGRVLDAIDERSDVENTVVIFSSDHGDLDSAHRMEHKTAFYEEPCRIPLIVSQPGTTAGGLVNNTHLVSNGLDLVPTLCDYAGIEVPTDLKGLSFRPLAEDRGRPDWRTRLPIESQLGQAVVTDRYKYILYDEGEGREQLMDLQEDPFETRNAARDPDKQQVLDECRKLLGPAIL